MTPGTGTAAPYDAIARDYQRTRESPLRRYIEQYTVQGLLGEVRDLRILDVGCGEGFYARRLAAAGAAEVTGVDISPAMIELAREQERAAPLGIAYHCLAAENLPVFGAFDLALGAYLLHYAPTRDALAAMAAGLAANLRPGGRLVALVENPLQSEADYRGYDRYGFNKYAAEPRREGARIGYTLVAGRRMIRFDTFYYGCETYEAVLAAAGFGTLAWHRPALDPAAPADSAGYWDEYLENPPVLGLTACLERK